MSLFKVYLVVTCVAAAANAYAALCDIRRPVWLSGNMERLHIPSSWLPALGAAKALGAVGLLAGIAAPWIGVAAAMGLLVFFLGAIGFALQARWYAHIPFPLVWLALAVAALLLRVSTWNAG